MRRAERRKVNVLEMKCLRSLAGVSRMDRVTNEEVRRRAGIEMELASRADQRVLSWFGHVERMDDYHPNHPEWFGHVERMDDYHPNHPEWFGHVERMEVSGGRVRGKPRLGWMDDVKVALGNRGMMVEAARQCATDRKEWRALVRM